MPEIPDVVGGETIEAGSWGNPIRDRSVQRYTDATSRDSLNATPGDGDVAYLTGTAELQIFDGSVWVTYETKATAAATYLALTGGTLTGNLFVRATAIDDFDNPHLSVGSGSDAEAGLAMLTLNIARRWAFRQRGSGAGTELELTAESAKNFIVVTSPGVSEMLFSNIVSTGIHSASTSVRNVLVGTSTPDNAWGADGDIYVRFA